MSRLREAKGLSQQALAKLVGVRQSYIGNIESGRNKSVGPEKLPLLAAALGVQPSDLAAFLPGKSAAALAAVSELPFRGGVAASRRPLPADEADPPTMVPLTDYFPPGHFLMQVVGDSMAGVGVNNGDVIVVRPTADPGDVADGDIVVAIYEGGRVLKGAGREGDRVYLYSLYHRAPAEYLADSDSGPTLLGILVRSSGLRKVPKSLRPPKRDRDDDY